jgi:hypothetical protein
MQRKYQEPKPRLEVAKEVRERNDQATKAFLTSMNGKKLRKRKEETHSIV